MKGGICDVKFGRYSGKFRQIPDFVGPIPIILEKKNEQERVVCFHNKESGNCVVFKTLLNFVEAGLKN